MATVAILGGGISGLSCAYYLKSLGRSSIKYLFLLEKGPKFGGWIQSKRFDDGAVCELGPRSLRASGEAGYNLLTMAEEIGLTSRIFGVTKDHPAAKKRLVLVKNQLSVLPNSLRHLLVPTAPFTEGLYKCVYRDLTVPKKTCEDDSVYSFAERRLGREVADYVFDPLCRGVTAGDARLTSLRSLLPDMFVAEQKQGSIIKYMVKSDKSAVSSYLRSPLVSLARKQSWRMWNLKSGMSELIETLASAVDERGVCDIHVNAECTKLDFRNGKASVTVDGDNIPVDHVFSCLPSRPLSRLLPQYKALSDVLKAISSVCVAIVYLEYPGFVLKEDGFGYLTPSFEDSKVLGVVFDSCCFPEHNGPNRTRLTCMMGGKWFTNLFGDPESVTSEQLLSIAKQEIQKHLNISATPARCHVEILKDCIPQYEIGHHSKIELATKEIEKNNLSLTLLGAYHSGAGVPQLALNAKKSVENYLRRER